MLITFPPTSIQCLYYDVHYSVFLWYLVHCLCQMPIDLLLTCLQHHLKEIYSKYGSCWLMIWTKHKLLSLYYYQDITWLLGCMVNWLIDWWLIDWLIDCFISLLLDQCVQYYSAELELVQDFGSFTEYFETFSLYRGKKSMDDEDDDMNRLSGYFKVLL